MPLTEITEIVVEDQIIGYIAKMYEDDYVMATTVYDPPWWCGCEPSFEEAKKYLIERWHIVKWEGKRNERKTCN